MGYHFFLLFSSDSLLLELDYHITDSLWNYGIQFVIVACDMWCCFVLVLWWSFQVATTAAVDVPWTVGTQTPAMSENFTLLVQIWFSTDCSFSMCPKASPSGGFMRISGTLNRASCHHFRWCGTDLMREMKWVSSRWNHVCTITNTRWVLELNGMRAYEITNMKQCIVGVSFIHNFICVLVMWHSWKQQNETTQWD